MHDMRRRPTYVPRPAWPRRAWVAHGPTAAANEAVVVEHGAAVETRPDWFGEIVWDGAFEDGAFDRTEVVFGSGGRLRTAGMTFVSSASTLDRLHVVARDGRWYVSNSLPAVLVVSGDRLVAGYDRYFADVDTIRVGLDGYRRSLPTRAGSVELVYHRDVVVSDGVLQVRDKVRSVPPFTSYAAYRRFLDVAIARLAENARWDARAVPLRLVGTLSNGYDSTAVTAAAAPHGLDHVLSFPEQGGGAERLADTAERLGLKLVCRDRYAFRSMSAPEPTFLASCSYGYEMPFAAFRDELRDAVLLTGYYGDVMWSSRSDRPARPSFEHVSQSGLSLTEFRLHAGFVHAPLPFVGARRARELEEITEETDMDAWRLGTGYDRPIARRIAEEAGVSRSSFGYVKMRGSSTPRLSGGMSPESDAEFRAWLRATAADVRRSMPLGLPAHRVGPVIDALKRPVFWVGQGVVGLLDTLPTGLRKGYAYRWSYKFGRRLRMYGHEWFLFRFTAVWAVERVMRSYQDRSDLNSRSGEAAATVSVDDDTGRSS